MNVVRHHRRRPPPPRTAQRTTAVMAKTLRIQREQADATVALIEQATPVTGRIIDVRA